ncbi:hypothetical protein DH2020_028753 [Rehmannia glutinosa]|uniref:ADF-H domain-containing protein n=1 Tax=Rehmannia glutinosa TaxID=99300 RepID=A0ABR0VUP7_REHGL
MSVDDECKLRFLELKAKRNYRFIIFKIEEKIQRVIVEKLGQPGKATTISPLAFPTTSVDMLAPDTSRIRSKMVYASSKDRFKRELDGIQVELQATDPSEMSIDIVKARAL